jgi:hypothetical protein
MNNETEGLLSVNLAVESLYRVAQNLSVSEKEALIHKLMYGSNTQETTERFENISAQIRILQQVSSMAPNDMALVLEAIAARLRSADIGKDEL